MRLLRLFNCSIDYIIGLSKDFTYPNLTKGFKPNCFYTEYQRLLKESKTNHFRLEKKGIVTETSLSSWKKGNLPKFEVLVAIAFELGGSLDKMLGRI